MLIWFLITLALVKVQISSSRIHGNVVEKEYYFGLKQFQDSVDLSRGNLSKAQINFLTENLNQLVLYGENLTYQSKTLFDNYGFIVDAKRVYLFVSAVRNRIKNGITHTISKHSSIQIRRNVLKVYQTFSINLKNVFDKEIIKLHEALNRGDDGGVIEDCWDAYKIPIFELGFDVVNEMKILSNYEAEKLTKELERMKLSVSANIFQLITDLSMTSSTIFPTRLRVNTFIEDNQEKILQRIDFWFQQIGTSLQQASENVELGAEKSVEEAENRLEDLSREIHDCIANE